MVIEEKKNDLLRENRVLIFRLTILRKQHQSEFETTNRNNIRTKVILSAALLHYSGYTSILKN